MASPMAREIVQRTWSELKEHLNRLGFELIEVEYGQHGGTKILRIYIDHPEGVTIDNCAEVSNFLSPILDQGEFVDERYVLEVSSPGIDRPIRKPADFERFIGEAVKVKTESPVDGRKKFRGVLTGFRDGMVTLDCDGRSVEIHLENLKRANLDR